MAAIAGSFPLSTLVRSCLPLSSSSSSSGNVKLNPSPSQRRFAKTEGVIEGKQKNPYALELERNDQIGGDRSRKGLKDYFDESKDLIRSDGGGGPPRWFSPLDCGSRLDDSPLLLYLPGIDGVGLGLIMHHQALGKIFDIWCLHIPVKDRTSFTGLVKLVEQTVRSENYHSPNRPIYLVGESLGACLALAVAARNPDAEIVLILSNPGTSFEKSKLQPLKPPLEIIPLQYHLAAFYMLSSMTDSLFLSARATGFDNCLR